MSQLDPKAPDVKALASTVAALSDRLADTRAELRAVHRRLSAAGIKDDTVNLVTRLEQLAAEVADTLQAAAPRGPAAPRWDNLDLDARTRQLAALQKWVTTMLIPGWVNGGSYELAPCWAQHPQAIWELGTIAARWRQTYERPRPDLALALEWHDRWLPGAMRRIAEATRHCTMGHQAR